MYSVLIPTYNTDVRQLVGELHRQATELMLDFEVIVLEDGSENFREENRMVSELIHCRYIELDQNIGRSAARNRLADVAQYPYLIFMDCDAEIQHDDYLRRYANFFREEDVIVIGGTSYDDLNKDPRYSLRLTYGRKREANMLYHNRQSTFNNFTTFNFLISANIIKSIRFNESIVGYGHEDTLFGHALHEAGYSFYRIDNTLIHKGLDDNYTFLRKTEESVYNLYKLYCTYSYPFLQNESHLLNTYEQLKKRRLITFISISGLLIRPFLRWQLCSAKPSLRLYDFYKLAHLCTVALRN
jgi:glycosyltransferase involved in cell wall biosynthesis